jgi:ribosomal protein S18 acetylase RimI-like enzyme
MTKIIKAQEKHIPAIKELWWEFICFHTDIEPFFTPVDNAVESFEKEFLRKEMKSDKSLVQVSLDGEKVIGYSISEIQYIPSSKIGRCGYINHLHVAKDYRRQGIGEKMYNEIITWFQKKDIKVVELQLTTKNEVAYNFWRKLGYKDLQLTWYKEI